MESACRNGRAVPAPPVTVRRPCGTGTCPHVRGPPRFCRGAGHLAVVVAVQFTRRRWPCARSRLSKHQVRTLSRPLEGAACPCSGRVHGQVWSGSGLGVGSPYGSSGQCVAPETSPPTSRGLMHQDLSLAVQLGDKLGVPLPGRAPRIYQLARAQASGPRRDRYRGCHRSSIERRLIRSVSQGGARRPQGWDHLKMVFDPPKAGVA